MLGRFGWSLARFVGLTFVLAGAWVFVINLVETVTGSSYQGWVAVWVLFAGLAGAGGGTLFLLSIDGPERFRTRRTRLIGWVMMWGLAALPSALILVLPPLLVLTIPALTNDRDAPPMTLESAN